MVHEQCRREIEELHEAIQEVEGRLAEQLSELKQDSNRQMGRIAGIVGWLVETTVKLLDLNHIVDPNTGRDLRPEMKKELSEILSPPKGK